jgi:lipoic acid synthetase
MPRKRLPSWIRVKVKRGDERQRVARLIHDLELHTVCQGARCPNLAECWHRRSATFMILGDHCTRDCAFCAVGSGHGQPPPPDEATRVAEAAARMELTFVVVTSVTRDDLPDGGAGHFAATIEAVRARLPGAGIEVLTPDFNGRMDAVRTVVAAEPTVFNHNLETCRRLTPAVRSGAGMTARSRSCGWPAASAAGSCSPSPASWWAWAKAQPR